MDRVGLYNVFYTITPLQNEQSIQKMSFIQSPHYKMDRVYNVFYVNLITPLQNGQSIQCLLYNRRITKWAK